MILGISDLDVIVENKKELLKERQVAEVGRAELDGVSRTCTYDINQVIRWSVNRSGSRDSKS